MSYQFLEHESDIGIRAQAKDEAETFEEMAKAMFEVMVDVKKIKPKEEIKIKVSAPGLEQLLIEWLNELVFQKDFTGLYFSVFKVDELKKGKYGYSLRASVKGEKLDRQRHQIRTEVKAATYSGLKCGREKKKFFCQCVLDV